MCCEHICYVHKFLLHKLYHVIILYIFLADFNYMSYYHFFCQRAIIIFVFIKPYLRIFYFFSSSRQLFISVSISSVVSVPCRHRRRHLISRFLLWAWLRVSGRFCGGSVCGVVSRVSSVLFIASLVPWIFVYFVAVIVDLQLWCCSQVMRWIFPAQVQRFGILGLVFLNLGSRKVDFESFILL